MQRNTRSVLPPGWWSSFRQRAWQGGPRRRRRSASPRVQQLETRLTLSLSTLASFNRTHGANPFAGLIMDSSGNLYGTTKVGGTSGDGTVFELAQGSGAITTLASFNYTDGEYPEAALIMDNNGNLYGTALLGGAGHCGTVFELAHGSGTITRLASFGNSNGAEPIGGLIMDSSGNLYGTTDRGGASGWGTVFELNHGGRSFGTLASFDITDGANPHAGVILDSSGNLYGTASLGGTSCCGTVFEVAHGSGKITALVSFNRTDGEVPDAGLLMDSSGNLYGTAESGGASGDGTVFELTGDRAPTDQRTAANFAVDTAGNDVANCSPGTPPYPGQTALFTHNSSVNDFTSTVDAGFASAIAGLDIDSTWGGTSTVNSPLSATGNFSLGGGSFAGRRAVTIAGRASRRTGGQIDLGSGGFTNTGAITADTTGGNRVLTGAGSLINSGTINEAGTNSLLPENTAMPSSAGSGIIVAEGPARPWAKP